jgi:moderate conductance mechanosensitive channel
VTQPDLSQLSDAIQRDGLNVLILLVLAFIVFRVTRPIVHRALVGFLHRRGQQTDDAELTAEEVAKRVTTLEDLFSTALRFTVILTTILILLTWLDLFPVIAGLGVLLAALTLAGQSIVLDYLMGVLIVFEGPYYKGDWVQLGGVEGEVEEVGLRRTILRDSSGTVHSVSNGQARIASNLTRVYARMQVDITVAFGSDLDAVTRVVNEVGQAMAVDPAWSSRLLEVPTLLRVPALSDLGVTIRVAGKVKAADRWAAPSELRRRLLTAFQANGIEIPARGRVVLERDQADPSAPIAPDGGPAAGADAAGEHAS